MCHSSGSVLRCAVLLLSERGDIPHQLRLAPTLRLSTAGALRTCALMLLGGTLSPIAPTGPFSFSQELTVLCVGDEYGRPHDTVHAVYD